MYSGRRTQKSTRKVIEIFFYLIYTQMSKQMFEKERQRMIAFTQNQREEVRDLGDIAGTIHAESGSHQTTYIALENHPNDSRIKMKEDDICQTLSSRMGTGGNNEPMVLIISK